MAINAISDQLHQNEKKKDRIHMIGSTGTNRKWTLD